jgi:hypothetical protein
MRKRIIPARSAALPRSNVNPTSLTSPTLSRAWAGKFGRGALDSVFVKNYMRNIRSSGCAEVFHLKGNGQAEPFYSFAIAIVLG